MNETTFDVTGIKTVNKKPKICDNCKNTDLRENVVNSQLIGQNVSNTVLCVKCGLVFVVKPPPKTMLKELKRCIAFIYNFENEKELDPIGTGFFVKLPVEHISNGYQRYFVTAKHVIQKSTGGFLTKIVIRVNKKGSGVFNASLDLEPDLIFQHVEPEVDIVAIPLNLIANIDYKSIPIDIIKSHEELENLGIGDGDDVFFSGLFRYEIDSDKNQPIYRFGKVSLFSNEKIEWKDKGKLKIKTNLYLIDSQSSEGNSGSPVFFRMSQQHEIDQSKKSHKIHLAGILKGSYSDYNEILSNQVNALSMENMGITAITPAYKLREILFGEKALSHRKTLQPLNPKSTEG